MALSPKWHKVHLQEAQPRLVPVRERPHRDLGVKKGPGLGGCAPPQGLRAVGTKHAVDGSWAQLHEKRFRLWPDPKFPFSFEHSHDLGKERG
ncbi:MAG: hypothetical protein QXI12_05035 [Candidatus Methanomethyliaceae archaeon]